ncbi:MAG: aminotransferase class V-fold PLP-dependent enzyme [Spirochaetia bacterium]
MNPVYLNNAATSFPKPAQVIEAVNRVIRTVPADHHRSHSRGLSDPVEECREACAAFLGVTDSETIFLGSGATEALNILVHGLLSPGDHVVVTSRAHNSVLRPLNELAERGVISLTTLETDIAGIVPTESFGDAVRENTRAVFVNHASNVTGSVADLEEIRRHIPDILLIVDASQAAGMIDIDLAGGDVDALVFTGHKYLFGLPGTGGMYLRRGLDLEPLVTGGTGVMSDSLLHPRKRPFVHEAGTPNGPGFAALAAGIRFIREIGLSEIRSRTKHLADRLAFELASIPRVRVIGRPAEPAESAGAGARELPHTPVVSFIIEGLPPDETGYILEESFGIKVRSGLHCAPLIHRYLGTEDGGTVRASLSYFTTEDEIGRLLEAVRMIAERCT